VRFILINIFLLLSFNIFSQNVNVKAILDSNQIKIGNQVTLSLVIEKTKDVEVKFPLLLDTITKQVEIIKKLPVDTLLKKDNILKLQQRYIITSFDSGVYTIPPLNFLVKIDSLIDTIKSNPLILSVNTVPVDTLNIQIKDIKAPFIISMTLKEILIYILYILSALIIILVAIYIIRKYRKHEPIVKLPEKPKEPAYIIALRELDNLKNEKLWQNNKIKKYHSDLTEIIRSYIENRFGLMALEQTSYEILYSINNSGLVNNPSFESLKQILSLADMVKFAKAQPLPDENDLSLRNAYLFVNETKDEIEAKPELQNDETNNEIKNSKELND